MKVLCDKTTKKIEGFSRWGDIDFNPSTHIVLDINHVPDMEKEQLSDTGNSIRFSTQTELDIYAAITLTDCADIEAQFNEPLKDFSLVVLSEINILRVAAGLPERTIQQLKGAVEAKL